MFGKIYIDKDKHIQLVELPQTGFTKEIASQFRKEQKEKGYSEFLFTNDFFIYLIEALLKKGEHVYKIEVFPNNDEIDDVLKHNMIDADISILLDILSDRNSIDKINKIEFYFNEHSIEMNAQGIIAGNTVGKFMDSILREEVERYLQ